MWNRKHQSRHQLVGALKVRADSGRPRKEASEVAVGTKESLDQSEGCQGRGKHRAEQKQEQAVKGKVEPNVLRFRKLWFWKEA